MTSRSSQRPIAQKISRKIRLSRSASRSALTSKHYLSLQRSISRPMEAAPETMVALQRTYGNRAVQRLTTDQASEGGALDTGLSTTIERSQGGGQQLTASVRGPMEHALQSDFSNVRVHTDSQADRLNRSVQAEAFTLGRDIYFRKDNYAPATASGKKLLAHELTHVVQQTGRQTPAMQRKPTDQSANQQFKAADPRQQLAALHPSLQAKAQALIENAHKTGLNVFAFQGMRTIAEQDALYAQGRTTAGTKVTNAKGGESYHNYGVAVDFVFHGKEPWGEQHDWQALGAAGKEAGLEWGGDWASFRDRPHFQLPGIKLSQLQAWYKDGGMTTVWKNIGSDPSKSSPQSSTTEKKMPEKKTSTTSLDFLNPIKFGRRVLKEVVNAGKQVVQVGKNLVNWLTKRFTSPPTRSSQTLTMATVTASKVNVRQGPDAKTVQLGQLVQGTQVTVIGRQGKWLQITYQGQPAFIYADYTTAKGVTDKEEVIDRIRQYDPYIQAASQKFGVPVETIRAIIAVESRGVAEASSGAAFGLMQLLKGTWQGVQDHHADLKDYDFPTYWKDPKINILFGTAALKGKMDAIGMNANGSAELAITAYNGGEGTVKKALQNARAGGSKDPENDCLKPEYLKPAIKFYKSVYQYYLTGDGKKHNEYVDEKGVIKEGKEEQAVQRAVDLKYTEMSRYPQQVREYLALQGKGSTPPTSSTVKKETPPSTESKPKTTPQGPSSTATTGVAKVTANALNVRYGPNVTTAQLGKLQRGDQVTVTGRTGEWLRITYEGKPAYIHSGFVEFTPSNTASPLGFVKQLTQIGKGLFKEAMDAGKDLWNWVAKRFNSGTSSSNQLAYESQRDNAYDQRDDNGERVYGGVMCNVTTLAMQLETLAGNKEKAADAAVQLLQKNGDKTSAATLRQKQLEDLLMMRFDQITKKNEWPTFLGKDYQMALHWHQNKKIPWNQIATALNRVGLEFTAFIANAEHTEPSAAKGITQEQLTSEEYYRKTLGPITEKQQATAMLSTGMTDGHIVLFAQALSDGILINDPYGALLKEAGASNYLTNGLDKNTAATRLKGAGDQVIKDRLKYNKVALNNLMSVIAPDNKTGAKVPQNIGELNFYTWSEIKKFTICKWNNVLYKK